MGEQQLYFRGIPCEVLATKDQCVLIDCADNERRFVPGSFLSTVQFPQQQAQHAVSPEAEARIRQLEQQLGQMTR